MIEVKPSMVRNGLYFVVSLAFVVIALFVIRESVAEGERPEFMAWGSLVFFGACTVGALMKLVRPGPSLLLSSEGITDSSGRLEVLPWSEVTEVHIVRAGLTWLTFTLRNPEAWVPRIPSSSGWLATLEPEKALPPWLALGQRLGHVSVRVNDMTMSPLKILEAVYAHLVA